MSIQYMEVISIGSNSIGSQFNMKSLLFFSDSEDIKHSYNLWHHEFDEVYTKNHL